MAGNYRFLVTGASGFLGQALTTWLVGQGHEVCGMDVNDSALNRNSLPGAIHSYHHIKGPIVKYISQAEEFLTGGPQRHRGIFHMAGLAEAKRCIAHPDQAFEHNVRLTHTVLELCRRIGEIVLVFPSTGLVYGDSLGRPATEKDQTNGESVYAATKLAAEALVRAYCTNYGFGGVIARLSNVYGPDSSQKTVVGKIIDQAIRGGPVQVLDESPIRDFIFYQDVVKGLTQLIHIAPARSATTVNLSSGIRFLSASLRPRRREFMGFCIWNPK